MFLTNFDEIVYSIMDVGGYSKTDLYKPIRYFKCQIMKQVVTGQLFRLTG